MHLKFINGGVDIYHLKHITYQSSVLLVKRECSDLLVAQVGPKQGIPLRGCHVGIHDLLIFVVHKEVQSLDP